MVKWWGSQGGLGNWDAWGGHGGKVVRMVGVVSVVTQSGHSDTLWIVPGTHLVEIQVAGTNLPKLVLLLHNTAPDQVPPLPQVLSPVFGIRNLVFEMMYLINHQISHVKTI